jgi:hypothetical protein
LTPIEWSNEFTMQDDERCCGTGTCIIDNEGRCWCGQQWDGEKMCHPAHPVMPPPAIELEPGRSKEAA